MFVNLYIGDVVALKNIKISLYQEAGEDIISSDHKRVALYYCSGKYRLKVSPVM